MFLAVFSRADEKRFQQLHGGAQLNAGNKEGEAAGIGGSPQKSAVHILHQPRAMFAGLLDSQGHAIAAGAILQRARPESDAARVRRPPKQVLINLLHIQRIPAGRHHGDGPDCEHRRGRQRPEELLDGRDGLRSWSV